MAAAVSAVRHEVALYCESGSFITVSSGVLMYNAAAVEEPSSFLIVPVDATSDIRVQLARRPDTFLAANRNDFTIVTVEGAAAASRFQLEHLEDGKLRLRLCDSPYYWYCSSDTCTVHLHDEGSPLSLVHSPTLGMVTAKGALEHMHGQRVSLWKPGQGWLTAHVASLFSSSTVSCRTARLAGWETFGLEVVDKATGTVALKTDHGLYLCSRPDGGVIADRQHVDSWETFTLLQVDGGTAVALRSCHGHYLSSAHADQVDCTRADAPQPEHFFMLFSSAVALRLYRDSNPSHNDELTQQEFSYGTGLAGVLAGAGMVTEAVTSALSTGLATMGLVQSPVALAMSNDDPVALQAALASSPRAATDKHWWTGWTVLHEASSQGKARLVSVLLGVPGVDINVRTARGWSSGEDTALHVAAKHGHPACIRVLLKAGADVEARCQKGWTALDWAAHKDDPACIEPLLVSGASPVNKSTDSGSALHIAVEAGATRAVAALLQVTPPVERDYAFSAAVAGHRARDMLPVIRLMLERGAVSPSRLADMAGSTAAAAQTAKLSLADIDNELASTEAQLRMAVAVDAGLQLAGLAIGALTNGDSGGSGPHDGRRDDRLSPRSHYGYHGRPVHTRHPSEDMPLRLQGDVDRLRARRGRVLAEFGRLTELATVLQRYNELAAAAMAQQQAAAQAQAQEQAAMAVQIRAHVAAHIALLPAAGSPSDEPPALPPTAAGGGSGAPPQAIGSAPGRVTSPPAAPAPSASSPSGTSVRPAEAATSPADSSPAVVLSCTVCLDQQRDTALVPCGHTLCGGCAQALLAAGRACPICRAPIFQVMRVYM